MHPSTLVSALCRTKEIWSKIVRPEEMENAVFDMEAHFVFATTDFNLAKVQEHLKARHRINKISPDGRPDFSCHFFQWLCSVQCYGALMYAVLLKNASAIFGRRDGGQPALTLILGPKCALLYIYIHTYLHVCVHLCTCACVCVSVCRSVGVSVCVCGANLFASVFVCESFHRCTARRNGLAFRVGSGWHGWVLCFQSPSSGASCHMQTTR
jgi:hypothetical protein